MTTCVSLGICTSRSSLRLGASEGESDALFGKGSGSRCRSRRRHWRRFYWSQLSFGSTGSRSRGELAEQAVALKTFDSDRQYLPDDIGRRDHMRRLQIGGAADDLAGIAGN